jgi:hypothetical protein
MWLQNDFKLYMQLWLVTIVSLQENKNEKCSHIIWQLVTYNNENLVVFATGNVIHN